MELISRKMVDTTWLQISQSDVEEIIPDQKRLMDNQPNITNFLVQFTEDYPEEVTELALHLTHIIWKIFSLDKGKIVSTVSLDDVIKAVKTREQWLEVFQELDPQMISNLIRTEQSFQQPHILGFISDKLREEQTDNPDIGISEYAYIFWLMIVVIDSFNSIN